MGGSKVLSLLAATLHIIMWHQCKSTKIITDTSVASAEFPNKIKAAVDMVEHPDNKDKLLALLDNDQIAEIDLNPLTVTILSNGNGFENGDLSQTKFNNPTAIIKIALKIYAIADRGNNCIRKLTWSDSPNVTCLDGSIAPCQEEKKVRFLAKHPKRNVLYAVGNEFTEVNLHDETVPQNQIIDAVSSHLNEESNLLGLIMSTANCSLYFLVFTSSTSTVTIISYDLTSETAGVIFPAQWINVDSSMEISATPTVISVTDAHIDNKNIKDHKVYGAESSTLLLELKDHRAFSFKQVGNHIIGNNRHWNKVLFDFDLVDETVHSVNFPGNIGPGIYIKDDFLYTFHRSTLFKYSMLSSCDQRYSQRPAHLSFAWLRTGSHGCSKMENNQLGDSIPLNQSQHGTGCPHQTCYSNCQQHCKDNPKCVAFQCHTYTQECRLSTCAMVSDEYKPDLSCYRLADIAYA